ncbi:MAG: hypothetical protein ACTHN8_16220 [Angustibacter sp.]
MRLPLVEVGLGERAGAPSVAAELPADALRRGGPAAEALLDAAVDLWRAGFVGVLASRRLLDLAAAATPVSSRPWEPAALAHALTFACGGGLAHDLLIGGRQLERAADAYCSTPIRAWAWDAMAQLASTDLAVATRAAAQADRRGLHPETVRLCEAALHAAPAVWDAVLVLERLAELYAVQDDEPRVRHRAQSGHRWAREVLAEMLAERLCGLVELGPEDVDERLRLTAELGDLAESGSDWAAFRLAGWHAEQEDEEGLWDDEPALPPGPEGLRRAALAGDWLAAESYVLREDAPSALDELVTVALAAPAPAVTHVLTRVAVRTQLGLQVLEELADDGHGWALSALQAQQARYATRRELEALALAGSEPAQELLASHLDREHDLLGLQSQVFAGSLAATERLLTRHRREVPSTCLDWTARPTPLFVTAPLV